MVKGSKNYITRDGFKRLKDEAHQLFHTERPKVVEVVSWAASNGDRSENADYHYGKKRLREIDGRLRSLALKMDASEIVDPKLIKTDKIVFGATVTIEFEDESLKTYQIVGEDEIDTTGNKISWKSPIAKALLGKKEGDEAILKKPSKEEYITIIKVEYI